ncbi:MAG: hypothetical protein HUK15_01725, partial [Bacteroidales bacterium]|nr:hypothetical protein [Bacteroidales bacterium]
GFTHYKSVVVVPQCGYLAHLSANMFKDKSLKVYFDENLGSISDIETK